MGMGKAEAVDKPGDVNVLRTKVGDDLILFGTGRDQCRDVIEVVRVKTPKPFNNTLGAPPEFGKGRHVAGRLRQADRRHPFRDAADGACRLPE